MCKNWKYIQGKGAMFDETADNHVSAKFIFEEGDYAVEIFECPHCHGLTGVDATFLEQVTDAFHCSICCMELIADEP